MGGFLRRGGAELLLGPIHIKEAQALLVSLQSLAGNLKNQGGDAWVDNQAVVHSWNLEGPKDPGLIKIMKEIFTLRGALNIELKVSYLPTKENPADVPLRKLCGSDSMLSRSSWERVQNLFGPHTFDLMSLDSNVMASESGAPLNHFTPFPLTNSSGVNMFAQTLTGTENYYVFPPYAMVAAVLRFLWHEAWVR